MKSEIGMKRERPAPATGVGNEKKAATSAAIGPGNTSMGAACGELRKQHPHAHDATMTNKETRDHIRHMPGRY